MRNSSIARGTVPATGAPNGDQQLRRRAKRGPVGEYLEVIDWKGLEIIPVRKDFWVEHPSTMARSEEECEAIRAKNSINVVQTPPGVSIPKPVPFFAEAPFPDWAQAQLQKSGFDEPTPIQIQAWPTIMKGYDFVGIAETGSGKTLAYLIPMLVHIMAQPELKPGEGPIALVIVPTRELCLQITRVVQSFSDCTGLVGRGLYGGEDIDEQARALAKRMDVAVATPGRLIALLNSSVTNLRRATFVVLDEADELLGSGFGDQVRLILSQVRPDRQALLFSATWPAAVEGLATEVCSQQPIHVNVGSIKLAACKSVKQRFRFVQKGESKFEYLVLALERIRTYFEQGQRALIFCNHKASVDPLVLKLRERGFFCEGFSGNQSQSDRDEVLGKFSQPNCNFDMLVCTQLLGRGHDFRNVAFVLNFDMPQKLVEYVHRIGRTGRAGATGCALTLMLEGDLMAARDLKLVLRESEQEVPEEINAAARSYWYYNGHARSQPFSDRRGGSPSKWRSHSRANRKRRSHNGFAPSPAYQATDSYRATNGFAPPLAHQMTDSYKATNGFAPPLTHQMTNGFESTMEQPNGNFPGAPMPTSTPATQWLNDIPAVKSLSTPTGRWLNSDGGYEHNTTTANYPASHLEHDLWARYGDSSQRAGSSQ